MAHTIGEHEACNTELRLTIGTVSGNLTVEAKNGERLKRKTLTFSLPLDMDSVDEYTEENQDDVVQLNELERKEKMEESNIHGRKKLRLSRKQLSILEETFQFQSTTLSPSQKQALGERLNLEPRQVEVWFQNRRARTKMKQAEVEVQLLKKCCERLSVDNQRLRNEVQELRAMMHSRPTCCMHKI